MARWRVAFCVGSPAAPAPHRARQSWPTPRAGHRSPPCECSILVARVLCTNGRYYGYACLIELGSIVRIVHLLHLLHTCVLLFALTIAPCTAGGDSAGGATPTARSTRRSSAPMSACSTQAVQMPCAMFFNVSYGFMRFCVFFRCFVLVRIVLYLF